MFGLNKFKEAQNVLPASVGMAGYTPDAINAMQSGEIPTTGMPEQASNIAPVEVSKEELARELFELKARVNTLEHYHNELKARVNTLEHYHNELCREKGLNDYMTVK